MRRKDRRLLGALAVLVLGGASAMASVVEVEVQIPVSEKIDTTGMRRLLVGGFRAGSHPSVDLDTETIAALRSLLRKNTRFEVLEVDTLPLPEQPIEDAIRNTAYWKRLSQRHNADLIIGGTVDFVVTDESGFAEQDYISDLTGHRQRHTIWVERESFKLDLRLYFFRGATGELIYEDSFTEKITFDGKGNDDLTILQVSIEAVGEGILSVITPRTRTETRYLFTE
jgi:hypothetical protein